MNPNDRKRKFPKKRVRGRVSDAPLSCSRPSPMDSLSAPLFDEDAIFRRLRAHKGSQREETEVHFHRNKKQVQAKVGIEQEAIPQSASYRNMKKSVKIHQSEIQRLKQDFPREFDMLNKKLAQQSSYQQEIESNFRKLRDQMRGMQKDMSLIESDVHAIKEESKVRKVETHRKEERLPTIQVKPRYILGSDTHVNNGGYANGTANHDYYKRPQKQRSEIRRPHVTTISRPSDRLDSGLHSYGVSKEDLLKFFKENHVKDIDSQNQIIWNAREFITKYSKVKTKYARKSERDKKEFMPEEEAVPVNIIDFALRNGLHEHNYRQWMMTQAGPKEIRKDTESKNKLLVKSLANLDYTTRYGKLHPDFRNETLLFYLDLKKLFISDFQFYDFLLKNYPNALKIYGYHLFPSILTPHHSRSFVRTSRSSHQEMPKGSKLAKSTIIGTNHYPSKYPSVTVRSEYLGNYPVRRPSVKRIRYSEYKSSAPYRPRNGTKYQLAEKVTQYIKRNSYSLEPKVIRRWTSVPRRLDSVHRIIKERVSRGPERMKSVTKHYPVRRVISKKIIGRPSEFGEWRVVRD